MNDMGLEVSRPVVPTSIQIDEALVDDFDAYPVRVRFPVSVFASVSHQSLQVVLKHERPEDEDQTEIVYAKYVFGADGGLHVFLCHAWVY